MHFDAIYTLQWEMDNWNYSKQLENQNTIFIGSKDLILKYLIFLFKSSSPIPKFCWTQIIISYLPGIFARTSLQPVNSTKTSILNWVMKLFMFCFLFVLLFLFLFFFLFLKIPWKIFHSIYLFFLLFLWFWYLKNI